MKRRKQRGHAMLELALSAGVMIACLTGTFQFGYTFYVYNQLVTAVGNGARYASVRPMTGDTEADKSAIRNMVVYGDAKPAPGSLPVAAHLGPEHVDVEYTDDGAFVRVAIHNYKVDSLAACFEFDGRPAVQFPYVGQNR